jgi:hypothetical protein
MFRTITETVEGKSVLAALDAGDGGRESQDRSAPSGPVQLMITESNESVFHPPANGPVRQVCGGNRTSV